MKIKYAIYNAKSKQLLEDKKINYNVKVENNIPYFYITDGDAILILQDIYNNKE